MSRKIYKTALLAAASLGCVAGQAAAQDADGGDIVVTARRIEERLQDVPISITVFNQEQLDDRNVTNATDLATYTPSLQTQNQFGANNAQFAIRGFVQDPFTAPSVGIYFADVIAPRGASSFQSGDGAGPGSFFDLQNVQVLKGPQGTLFGRNTTGGAVLLVPQKPGYDFGGYLEGSVGNYDMQRVQGVLNVPLGEHARARFGVDRQTREGYIDTVGATSRGPDHWADVDYWAGRASLVVDLTPNLENYTILTYAQSDTAGNLLKPRACNQDATLDLFGGAVQIPTGQMCQAQLDRLRSRDDNFFDAESLVDNGRNHLDQWQFINTTTWDVSDNLTVKNIFSYSELNNSLRSSVFGLTWITNDFFSFPGKAFMPAQAVTYPGGSINDASTLTEELQFQGTNFDNRLKWQAGVYYEAVNQIPDRVGTMQGSFQVCDQAGFHLVPNPAFGAPGEPRYIPNPAAICTLPYAGFGVSNVTFETRTFEARDAAIYAQATYDVTDRFNVEVGLRYTDDTTSGTTDAITYFYYDNALTPGPGPIGLPSDGFGGLAPAVSCTDKSAGSPEDGCSRTTSQHSNATTGEIVFGYELTDNWNTYLKYARGYRQGMANPRGFGFLSSFGQEQIDLYELGFKGNWHGVMPGYLNVAIFRNLLQNQQLNISYTSGTGSIASGVASIGKTTVDGVEIDGSISPFEGFRITGGLAWINSDLKSGVAPPTLPDWGDLTNPVDPSQDLPFSPEWKYSITPSYTLPLAENLGEVTLAATWSWTSDYVGGSGSGKVDSWGILNLNANWDHVFGSPVDLSFFGTNVLNEEYYTMAGDLRESALGVEYANVGEPRMYGVRLRYSFGGQAH